MRILSGFIALAALGACSTTQTTRTGGFDDGVSNPVALAIVAYENHTDVPFDSGTVSIVANEHGDLHSYSLTPCGGNSICGPDGRAGQVQRTPEYFVVTGAYRDRTFFLSQGGGGYLTFRGENRDLAWN